ncbi:cysteine--1-D-myo-inosityl 2-amino-2-deoxy-alpha-D-glucopyranoside ligase [Xylanimonas protaetiae]|uniref:L-cysteine:1D-myo-inositol 2-amino-2-deoxy-alpha-D-glucopyranoside ligase n=1 Tax=Xylanimonas protaetiae TaxID=2509457 RepID=A0A4P6F619_9MICO|nr:cysteine--1-D-myo-inosityl 2-amino-2-deoxy-alpha-D-glucopyranoside ligase [Xylanimonas protaetiae]QAY70856.1 cysteine--1-D-myo-inosityl 2-amino-2-deoxy-alpha-D-glucopyranoside ligase [Xylanimonas protaetiae]
MRAWTAPDVPTLPRAGAAAPVLVHDSTTRALVEAAPGAAATLYACGITPYDATHLGHANTYLAFDLLQRAWLDAGKTVVYTSNVTDVDDPLLERATATGVDWRDLALEQTELYRTDMTALRMLPPATWTGAVESIPAVVEAVTALLDAGAAYRVDRDVYADLSADAAFGTVAGFDAATMRGLFAERGGDPDRPGKRHPLDPALWRGEQPGEPSWDGGGLGPGRPGWHIECAVIARDGLGLPFDVQGGGADLLFPHHEMSTSHARLLGGGSARVHVHAGLLAYEGHKMSKSRGNLVFVSRLLAAGTDPMTIRLALLAHHYREEWEWTDAELGTAQRRLDRWTAAILTPSDDGEPASEVLDEVRAALAADLDAPRALAAVDRWAAHPGGDADVVVAAVDALLGVEL